MAQFTLTLTAGVSAITALNQVPAARWTAGFDHAALVAAGRSRADGNDLRMVHLVFGPVGIVSASGLNTSDCRIVFRAEVTVNAGNSDGQYRVIFGDLGATTPTWGASTVGTAPADATVTASAVPAVTLPSPGFPLERNDDPDSDGLGYPDTNSPRWSLRNQNDRPALTLHYQNIMPEDWYELRAFVRAKRGGASTWNPPTWLQNAQAGITSTDLLHLLSWEFTQGSRKQFNATIEAERVAA